jgi:hypothetical protein
MLANGYITGSTLQIGAEKENTKLMDSVVKTVSASFDFPDDNVQLLILKVRSVLNMD